MKKMLVKQEFDKRNPFTKFVIEIPKRYVSSVLSIGVMCLVRGYVALLSTKHLNRRGEGQPRI